MNRHLLILQFITIVALFAIPDYAKAKEITGSVGIGGSVSGNGSAIPESPENQPGDSIGNAETDNNVTVDIPNLLKIVSGFSGATKRIVGSIRVILGGFQNSSAEVQKGLQYALSRSNSIGNNSFAALNTFITSFRDNLRNMSRSTRDEVQHNMQIALDNFGSFLNRSSTAVSSFLDGVNGLSAEVYNNMFDSTFQTLKEGLSGVQKFRPRFPYVVLSSASSLSSQLQRGLLNNSIENILLSNPQLLRNNNSTSLNFSQLIQLLQDSSNATVRRSAHLISNQIWNFLKTLGGFFDSFLGLGGNVNASMTFDAMTGVKGGFVLG